MPQITLEKMDLHSGHLANLDLNLDPPKLDLTLRNVVVEDGWIKGEAEISASAFGAEIPKQTIPFKTKDNVEQEIDVIAGAKLHLKVRLADPHQVCGSASLDWGPLHPSTGEQCMAI